MTHPPTATGSAARVPSVLDLPPGLDHRESANGMYITMRRLDHLAFCETGVVMEGDGHESLQQRPFSLRCCAFFGMQISYATITALLLQSLYEYIDVAG